MSAKRSLAAGLLAIALIGLLLKLPSYRVQHGEQDEVIYLQLADKLADGGDYSLRGTQTLPYLDRAMYDRPLFHHPPLYVALLAGFFDVGWEEGGVVISWIAHFLAAIAVGLLVWALGGKNRELGLLVATAGAAFDPVLLFLGLKISLDGLLAALTIASLACFLVGLERTRRWPLWLGAGVLWGLALLTKLTAAVCAVPFLLGVGVRFWQSRDRAILRDALLVFLPGILLLSPWLIRFHAEYGVLAPDWIDPTPELLRSNAFLQKVCSRPWHYFATTLIQLTPLALLAVAVQAWDWRRTTLVEAVLWTMVAVTGTAMSFLAATGFGFQMRFVSMAVPPLCALVGIRIARLPAERARPLAAVGAIMVVWSAMTAVNYVLEPRYADVLSLLQILY